MSKRKNKILARFSENIQNIENAKYDFGYSEHGHEERNKKLP